MISYAPLRLNFIVSGESMDDLAGAAKPELFVEQFEKDLRFFQLFFLLISKSSPIKKVDLVWAKDGPAGRVGLRDILGTAHPLHRACPGLLECDRSADPVFCRMVNDGGRHEAESCATSDKAAEERIRRGGKTEVYRCHFGLTEIAVPVVCDGRHIATLFNGQVLTEPPSAAGFEQVRRSVAGLDYIDLEKLEAAYWQVPVVSEEDIRNATLVLETFADYLVTDWQRLSEIIDEQRRQIRESQLYRKEFAHLMLDGGEAEPAAVRESMGKIGFTACPDRVLVVKLESEEEYRVPGSSFDLSFTAALQAIEELCEKLDNVAAAYLRRRGVCVFFNDREGRNANAGEFNAQRLARRILHAVAERTDMRARVGIGGARSDWRDLAGSYHEACMALAAAGDVVCAFKKQEPSFEDLSAAADRICRGIAERKLEEAKLAAAALPLLANRRLGEAPEHLPAQRLFFASTVDSVCFAAYTLGAESAAIARLRKEAGDALDRAATVFDLQQAWLASAEYVLDEVRRLYHGKHEKIVERACRVIEQRLQQAPCSPSISLTAIASAFGISPGHLSRTFKQVTGLTFERYLMSRRVELAKRLLLEPLNNASQVAEKCGFSDPSYFARVFRKVAGCAPSEYARNPRRPSVA